MAAAIHPKRIVGNWTLGYALDVHTLYSTHVGVNEHGHDVFETKRSELGELLFRLKYRGDLTAVPEIVDAITEFLKRARTTFDLIVPVPPSGHRQVQPVIVLARAFGEALNLPVAECVTTTRAPTPLKGVIDRDRRNELLEGLYAVETDFTRRKSILLFDDLYRSGATMNAITDLLMTQGEARAVRVLTITKARRSS